MEKKVNERLSSRTTDGDSDSLDGLKDSAAEAEMALYGQARSLALEEGPERDRLYERHPVVVNKVKIATRPLQEAYEVVAQVVMHRDPGTCLIADFRIGKTIALTRITEKLMETMPDLPIGRVIAKGHSAATEKTFYTDVLTDFKHAGANQGTTTDRRGRLLNFMLAQAKHRKSDRYLLLVDEGQNWEEVELQVLRDLSNDLQASEVTLITVMFGHPELHNIRARLSARRRMDLIGRFLLTPREFRGLFDAEELAHSLRAYDDPMQHQYPMRSGVSYSEFFMPRAWQSGWRLAHEADSMWGAFRQVAAHANRQAQNIGMNWVTGAVRNFLFASRPADSIGFLGKPSMWVDAVEASGYEAS